MPSEDIPVTRPFLTDALVAKIHLANEEAGRREQAFNTSFRCSDAGGCARKMSYAMAGIEESNPPDLAGEWVMWLGTLIGQQMADALHDRFGSSCQAEVKVRHWNLTSGHIDVLLERIPGWGRIVYELKTKGGYGFDKAVGINRKAYKLEYPQGPGIGAKLQGSLYAAAVDADWLMIGVIGMESISRQLAGRVGWDDLQRFMGEWHYDKATYALWAKGELDRLQLIEQTIADEGHAPRMALGDEGEDILLNPNLSSPNWRCTYCSYLDLCKGDGA